MSDETTLLPCPFCGGEASWIAAQQREDGTYYPAACGCRKCGIWRYGESDYGHGGFATEQDRKVSMEQAILKWNTRATHGTLTAEQVRNALMSADRWGKPMGNTGLTNTHVVIRDDGWQAIAEELNELVSEINGDTSDGYHTFNELYHHRAVLFSVIVRDHRELSWKARKHHDGTMYDGMFIVGIETPKGQATYHYDLDPYWEMFDCEEREYAPEWDGHTPDEAIARIAELGSGTCELLYGEDDDGYDGWYCDECGGWFQAARRDGHLVEPKHCQECGKAVER